MKMNFCRTCGEMARSSYATHLYKDTDTKHTLLRDIEALTGLWLAFNDDMPVYVCAYCARDINQAIQFRERCIEMQDRYQKRHEQLKQRRKLRRNCEKQQEKIIKPDPLILEEIETLFEENEALDMDNEKMTNETMTNEKIDVSDIKLNYEMFERKDVCSLAELEINDNNHVKTVPDLSNNDLEINPNGTTNFGISLPATLTEYVVEKTIKITKSFLTTIPRKPVARNTNCNVCGMHFESVMSLKEHKLLHNVKRFPCTKCSKEFLTNRHLKEHLLRHTDMRPYSCRTCDETFRSRSHRNKHEIKHTNPPPYFCNFCEKEFASTDSRDLHEASHQGVGKYKCVTCDRAFMLHHRLKSHYKSMSHLRKVEALRLFNDENIT